MNVSSLNLIPLATPTAPPPVSVPVRREAPEAPSGRRSADKGSEHTNSSPRPAADDKGSARPEVSDKASRDNSGANNRPADKKGPKNDKTDTKVASDAASPVAPTVDAKINPEIKASGSVGVFATILQAAGQTGKKAAPKVAKTAPVVSTAPEAGPKSATEANVTVQGLSLAQATAQPAKLDKTDAPVVTVGADGGVLPKAVVPVTQGQVSPSQVAAPKDAPAEGATGKNPVVAPKTATTAELAAQLGEQNRKTIQPDAAPGDEVLKQLSLASMQGVASAAGKIQRPVKPNAGSASQKKVTLQTGSSKQAKAATSAVQSILQNRSGSVSLVGDRQAHSAVKDISAAGPNNVVGEAPQIDTAATEAVRGGMVEQGSPVKQITDAFKLSAERNGQEIVVRMNPPELGRVRVTLRLEGGEVRGVLNVENPKTLSQLQREAPNILGRLSDAGIDMKRMELSLTQDGARDSMRDPAWFSQQYGENGTEYGGWNGQGQERAADETVSAEHDTERELQPALMAAGDDSINIWI